MKALIWLKRISLYLFGMLVIAIGINFTKISGLGIAPVSSIPGVLNGKFPSISLGSMVMVVYCALVLAQFLVLRKKFRWPNIFGIPVAIVFGLMVDFFGLKTFRITLVGISIGIEKEFNGLLMGLPTPENFFIRILYLLAGILIIGIGVFIYLKPKLIPMPAEGLAAAIAQISGKAFGNCKTLVDVSLICIASILQLILLGGFKTFGIGAGVVGIGTILAAICVGQVVKYLSKLWAKLFAK